MVNLRSIDLNLIPVFEAAYEERSLSVVPIVLLLGGSFGELWLNKIAYDCGDSVVLATSS